MVCSYYLQLPLGLSVHGDHDLIGGNAGQLLRKGKVGDVAELLDELEMAIRKSLAGESQPETFFRLAETTILFCLCRNDFERLMKVRDLVEEFLPQVSLSGQASATKQLWLDYLVLVSDAVRRIMRTIPLEEFEGRLEEAKKHSNGNGITRKMEILACYVYLMEDDEELAARSKSTLEKSQDIDNDKMFLLNTLLLAEHHLRLPSKNSSVEFKNLIEKLQRNKLQEGNVIKDAVIDAAKFYLDVLSRVYQFETFDDDSVRHSHFSDQLRMIATEVERAIKDGLIHEVTGAMLLMQIATRYAKFAEKETDESRRVVHLALLHDLAKKAVKITEEVGDQVIANRMKLQQLQMAGTFDSQGTLQELRDLSTGFKKQLDTQAYVESVVAIARNLYAQNEGPDASAPLIDLVKTGEKRLDSGGLSLVNSALEEFIPMIQNARHLPGMPWLIEESETLFDLVCDLIEKIEDHLHATGEREFKRFHANYAKLKDLAAFNIKVYFRYQLYTAKLIRLNAILNKDELTLDLAENMIAEFSAENGPLFIMQGDWEDFKNVANDVRNRIINKSITITKGDLPAAAEHLDFSYRNLRSYITFNEVNRLGTFLEESTTKNRNLEEGIRLMLFDLYKQGTIFEVVFDIPQFLVENGMEGFTSRDMEEVLQIKGTTAKKYIRIMSEIELIQHRKSVGRKHYYFLNKDKVMLRLGKEAKTLAGPR